MSMIYEIIAIAIFANWITHWFKPLDVVRETATDVWTRYTIKMGFYPLQRLAIVFSCPKCFAFWFTLFYRGDFFLALNVSLVAFLIKFIIDKIEYWYEN